MLKRLFAAALAICLTIAFSCIAFSQETMQKEMKKDEMKKESVMKEGMMLKSVECDPVCGFMCRSHDEKELSAIVMEHAKKNHKEMKITEKDIKGMMKEVKMEMKKEGEMKKEMEIKKEEMKKEE